MPLAVARRVAALLAAKDTLAEWYDDTLKVDQREDEYPLVCFGDISVTEAGDDQERSGWQGELILPREVAFYMLEAAQKYVDEALRKCGVATE